MAQCRGRTKQGKPCPFQAKPGHLVCGTHMKQELDRASKAAAEEVGAPPDVIISLDGPDEAVRTKLLEAVAVGASDTTSARYSGVEPAQLQYWLEHNIADVATDVERKRAEFEVAALRSIHNAGKAGEWRAMVWALDTSGRVGRPSDAPGGGAVATTSPDALEHGMPDGMQDDQVGPDGKQL